MSNEKYDNKDMITFLSESFIEGYKYAVEIAASLERKIAKEYQAKHKKIIRGFIEDMKRSIAALDKDDLKKVAEEYLKEKSVREEILGRKEEETIIKPNEAQVRRFKK